MPQVEKERRYHRKNRDSDRQGANINRPSWLTNYV
jgi:hypothetical protein